MNKSKLYISEPSRRDRARLGVHGIAPWSEKYSDWSAPINLGPNRELDLNRPWTGNL